MKSVTNYLLMGIVAIAMFVGYGCSQDGVNGNTLLGIDSSVTQSQYNGYYTVDDIVGIIRFQKPY